jgi:capsular polysaccharide transport system permease protein
MRYGRENIGFAWVVLEPMILTLGVMVIWSITMGSTKYGVKLVELILTGYMPLTLWRHMTNNAVMIFRRSTSLLYHRGITLFDILAARLFLEFIATTAALLVVWVGLNLFGVVGDIERWDLLILGWAMMGWLAASCAFILAGVTEYSDTAERFVQPVQYLSIPISGAFAMVDWFPNWAQNALLLNPMVHCYEVFRSGFFGDYVVGHYSVPYFACWAFALTFVGILTTSKVRKRLQIT